MNGGGVDAVLLQLRGQSVRAVLGAGKDQHLAPVVGADQVGEQLTLSPLVHRIDHLGYRLGGGVAGGHLDHTGSFSRSLAAVRSPSKRSRRRAGSGAARQQLEHLADVVDEAHVEHAVRLVQHQDLHMGEVHGLLLGMVQQTAGRGHQDVDPVAQLGDLRVDLHPAEDHRGTSGRCLP